MFERLNGDILELRGLDRKDAEPSLPFAKTQGRSKSLSHDDSRRATAVCRLWEWIAGCRRRLPQQMRIEQLRRGWHATYEQRYERARAEGLAESEAHDAAKLYDDITRRDLRSKREGWRTAIRLFETELQPYVSIRKDPPWKLWDDWVGRRYRQVLWDVPGDPPAVGRCREMFLRFATPIASLRLEREDSLRRAVLHVREWLRSGENRHLASTACAEAVVSYRRTRVPDYLPPIDGREWRERLENAAESAEASAALAGEYSTLTRDRFRAAALLIVGDLTGVAPSTAKKRIESVSAAPSSV